MKHPRMSFAESPLSSVRADAYNFMLFIFEPKRHILQLLLSFEAFKITRKVFSQTLFATFKAIAVCKIKRASKMKPLLQLLLKEVESGKNERIDEVFITRLIAFVSCAKNICFVQAGVITRRSCCQAIVRNQKHAEYERTSFA